MANVIINKFCNLSCSYCFIKGTKHEAKETMFVESFQKVVNFLIKSNAIGRIGICGGEPTIHPNFREIMQIAYDNFEYVQLYTNGININQYFDLLFKHRLNTTYLINFNSPKDIGIDQYRKLRKNIDTLYSALNEVLLYLGVNIYTNNIEDYNYVFPVLEAYKIHKLRVSLCVPINNTEKELNPLDFFKNRHGIIIAFLAKCFEKNIKVNFDCNFPPPCIFTQEDKEYFSSLGSAFSESNIFANIGCKTQIMPLDILPNLLVSRCFGVDTYKAKSLDYFNNIDEIYDYFEKEIGIPSRNIMPDEKCYRCREYLDNGCICGCISYKLKELRKNGGMY